jgi:hypothetical protein
VNITGSMLGWYGGKLATGAADGEPDAAADPTGAATLPPDEHAVADKRTTKHAPTVFDAQPDETRMFSMARR